MFTMYGGRVDYASPMLWSIGFMVTFVIGGLTGVLVAVVPADFMLHNSLFQVAHFHNVIIGGVLFGMFAGYTFSWFPQSVWIPPARGLGRSRFLVLVLRLLPGFHAPLCRGLDGHDQADVQHYDVPEWRPWLLVAALVRRGRSRRHCVSVSHNWW